LLCPIVAMVAATILTAETVAAYVKNNLDKLPPGLVDAIAAAGGDDDDHWSVRPILGGNVNYAFCVTILGEHNNVKIFVKQAPEFVAIFGPDGFALTSERMQHEMDVYAEWRAILGDHVALEYLPNLYFFDKDHMAVCMEFLDGFTLLDHVLVDSLGVDLPCLSAIAAGLGDFMGRTHAATHSSKMDAERKEYLVKHYENRPVGLLLCFWVGLASHQIARLPYLFLPPLLCVYR
jgi:5-methylthioribose kinase